MFSCRVPLPDDAHYKIEWYKPAVDGITEGKNHLVTYLTKTKYAIHRDPNDRITQLRHDVEEREQALYNLSYAVVTAESIHDDHVQKFAQEARPFIAALWQEEADIAMGQLKEQQAGA
jgi:hypothetical protein